MMEWERELDIRGPLEQAERCIRLWLKEEKRSLSATERRRAAGLMARYFCYEDEVTDQLMMSFLRHYSSGKILDMEDPASVRMEIKSVLDQSQPRIRAQGRWQMALLSTVFLFSLAGLYGFDVAHRPITGTEQAHLKSLVHRLVVRNAKLTSDAVWNAIKRPLHIHRYADMDQWEYWQSREILEKRLRGR